MEHGLIYAEVGTGLALVCVLAYRGLLTADKLFTAYLIAFLLVTSVLLVWANALKNLPPAAGRDYTVGYFVLYALVLGIATFTVRVGWPGVAILIALATVWARSPRQLEGWMAAWMAWLALMCFVQVTHSDFDRVKLWGLGLFFVTQAAVSALYAIGPQSREAARNMTVAAGLAGVLALLWMAFSFGGLAPEGGSKVAAEPRAELAEAQAAAAMREGRS